MASHLTELELEPSPLNDLIILRPNHHIVCSAFRVSTVISAIQTSYLSLMLLLIDRSKVLGTWFLSYRSEARDSSNTPTRACESLLGIPD